MFLKKSFDYWEAWNLFLFLSESSTYKKGTWSKRFSQTSKSSDRCVNKNWFRWDMNPTIFTLYGQEVTCSLSYYILYFNKNTVEWEGNYMMFPNTETFHLVLNRPKYKKVNFTASTQNGLMEKGRLNKLEITSCKLELMESAPYSYYKQTQGSVITCRPCRMNNDNC